MRRSWLLGLAAAAVVATASVAAADTVRWSLGLKHAAPKWVRVSSGASGSHLAWYMTYTVTNSSGATRNPNLRLELRTDAGKVHGDNADPRVVRTVARQSGGDLKTAFDLGKGIDDGATVRCVAVFGAIDDLVRTVEFRAYGLVSPIDVVAGKKYREVKYWRTKYERAGDEFRRADDSWKAVESGWVVESREELPAPEK